MKITIVCECGSSFTIETDGIIRTDKHKESIINKFKKQHGFKYKNKKFNCKKCVDKK